jgi:hypothetical protein
MNKKTVVVSAFPCCGKTYAFENYQDKYSILDSDSSNFSWMFRTRTEEELNELKKEYESVPRLLSTEHYINKYKDELIKVRNSDFPNNYIEHIKENLGKVDIIFVSSHLQVREAMEEAGIKYCTVYPKKEMLNEWVGRMYRRGNNANFIKFQIDNWDKFVNSVDSEPHGCKVYKLGNNEYIDVDLLYNDFNSIE